MNKPLSCIILDDEHLIRELLKRTIDWNRHQLSFLAEAESAMEAMDLVEEKHPDLLIVDICIPVINGIEFSRHILKKYPHLKIIILTGHDDFEYARQSLKIGVSDFLLKPINPEEINSTIAKACNCIRENKRQLKEYDYLKKQLEDNRPFLKERFFTDLLRGNLSAQDIQEKVEYYGIGFNSDMFQTALIEPVSLKTCESEEDSLLLEFQSIEYISRFLGRENEILIIRGDKDRIILINNNPCLFTSDYYETIKDNLIRSFNCSITIGVGGGKKGIESLSLSYNEAVKALEYKLIEGKNTVITFSDVEPRSTEECIDLHAGLNNFTFYLNAGIAATALSEMNRLLEDHCPRAMNEITSLQIPAVNILSCIVNTLRTQNIELSLLGQSMMELYNRLFVIDTLPEMINFLSELVKKVTSEINRYNSQKTGKLISEVKIFLKNNYSDSELTLQRVAERFYVNSSYLSRKFKEETKQSFVDYLSKLRLTKAVSLLQETDNRNYEISELIGIADPHYFSIFFKKHMNMSISEYRRKISQ